RRLPPCGRRSRASPSCSIWAPRSGPMPSILSSSPPWAVPWRGGFSGSAGRRGGAPILGVGGGKGFKGRGRAGKWLGGGGAGEWPQFEYAGFVEGDDIGKGTVDVVVTEGFSGNIALKAAEGTARQLGQYLKHEMNRTLARRLGYLLARGAFRALGNKMDPRKSNGGVFLGLNGIVIKSHGGTDAEGFAYAVDLGYDMVRHELLAKIGHGLTGPHSEVIPARAVGGAAS